MNVKVFAKSAIRNRKQALQQPPYEYKTEGENWMKREELTDLLELRGSETGELL